MRIRCSECKNVLVDTSKQIFNFIREEEFDVVVDDSAGKFELKPISEPKGVCINCGHRFELEKLEELLQG